MRSSRIKQISDIHELAVAAGDLYKRVNRMSAKEDSSARIDPQVLSDLFQAAERLDVVSRFSSSARGVPFLQHEQDILSGQRTLKHSEAIGAAGYLKREVHRHWPY